MPIGDLLKRGVFHALRTGFRWTPMPATTRDRLRQRFLERFSTLVPAGPRGQAPGNSTHRPAAQAGERAIGHVPYRTAPLPAEPAATLVAFYLPQFHAIPENDEWWGKGFTEWHNVTRALPQFEGHAQPRLPADLGYYDLRNPAVMAQQMRLAREYGISAFCMYFYWFAGHTLLEAPLRQWLDDPALDLPICLCWANENWSRRWDGRAKDILIGQRHSAEDDLAFISHVAPYLRDDRYLRVEGKPVLLVYRPGLLPDARATSARWRQWCRENGIGEIHLAYVQSFDRVDPSDIGFDAAVEFPPNNTSLQPITGNLRLINSEFQGDVFDWRELARNAIATPNPKYRLYPGVNPGWDNEPRRSGRGRSFLHASPRGYADWLKHAIRTAHQRSPQAPMVFLNAWNEWAEGAVLEPDTRLGYAALEATRRALCDASGMPGKQQPPCAVIHAWYVEVLDELLGRLKEVSWGGRIIVTTTVENEAPVREAANRVGVSVEIRLFENRGRDILPFLHVANELLDEGVTWVLKLHTKRSVHRADGKSWRGELLDGLLPIGWEPALLDRIDPSTGLLIANGHAPRLADYPGGNGEHVDYLLCRLGLPAPDESTRFPAGSMFWCRLELLRPLLDAHLEPSLFEAEKGQIDGTLAHAIERLFGHVVTCAGGGLALAGGASGVTPPDVDSYAYASKG